MNESLCSSLSRKRKQGKRDKDPPAASLNPSEFAANPHQAEFLQDLNCWKKFYENVAEMRERAAIFLVQTPALSLPSSFFSVSFSAEQSRPFRDAPSNKIFDLQSQKMELNGWFYMLSSGGVSGRYYRRPAASSITGSAMSSI